MSYEPVLLANIHKQQSHTLPVYEAGGGYRGLRRLLKEMSPKDVVGMVKASGLRGRGGAGFPTGLKWSFLPENLSGPVYFCVNADESEPGTFVNRVQMELDPHQVLEGIIISCYATRASTAYVYLRYEYHLSRQRMQAAIDECYAAGYLGKNILGSDFSLDVFIHRGAAAYVCGEETGLIESLEGRRAWPRIKPPFPAVEGLFRRPTVVNNVETLACVKHIVDRGVAWFRSMGTPPEPNNPRDPGSFGPKLYGLSGHVNRPGYFEAPLGISVRQLIDEFGGGVWKGRRAKAAVPGGLSTGLMTESEFDTPLDFSAPCAWAAWGLARPASWCSTRPTRYLIFCTTVAAFLPTKVAASVRPAARARTGPCKCWSGSSRAAGGCWISICCWRSAIPSASFPAAPFAAWPMAPLGPLRMPSASFAASSKTTSSGPTRRDTWKPDRWRRWKQQMFSRRVHAAHDI